MQQQEALTGWEPVPQHPSPYTTCVAFDVHGAEHLYTPSTQEERMAIVKASVEYAINFLKENVFGKKYYSTGKKCGASCNLLLKRIQRRV